LVEQPRYGGALFSLQAMAPVVPTLPPRQRARHLEPALQDYYAPFARYAHAHHVSSCQTICASLQREDFKEIDFFRDNYLKAEYQASIMETSYCSSEKPVTGFILIL